MRFGNIVKIDRRVMEESNAKTHSELIREAISQYPGRSSAELARIVYPNMEHKAATTKVSGFMSHLISNQKQPVKRRKQDGTWRYYATNYRMPYERVKEQYIDEDGKKFGTIVPEPEKPIPAGVAVSILEPPTAATEHIIALAKDFVWETGNHDIREFVKWIENHES